MTDTHTNAQGLRRHAQGLQGSGPGRVLELKENWTHTPILNPEAVSKDCLLISLLLRPGNHIETLLITTLFGQ